MDNPILLIVMRYIHIFSAVLAVGGTCFMGMCLTPAMKLLDENLRESLSKTILSRWQRVLWGSIGGLVVSGIFNWISRAEIYREMGPMGNALIGTKVLVAVILFSILGGLSTGLITFGKPKMWQMINVHLAALVILLASILRILSAPLGG